MQELTEQQVQEMIDLARAGDPEANYQMSQWALDQAVLEPDEERWNRLAAKCLVRAAEAGYEPAQERMDELIRQLDEDDKEKTHTEESEKPAPPAEDFPEYEPDPEEEYAEPVYEEPASDGSRPVDRVLEVLGKIGGKAKEALVAAGAGAMLLGHKIGEFLKDAFTKTEDSGTADEKRKARRRSGAKQGGKGGKIFPNWTEADWKKAQRICIVVAAALVIVLLIVLLSGHGKDKKDKKDEPAETVEDVIEATPTPAPPTPTPEPVLYPDETVRAEIAAASLDIYPSDEDFVSQATTGTVSTNGSALNLRRGTSADYGWIASLENGSTVEVYAYKNSWTLVKSGNTWGWASSQYVK